MSNYEFLLREADAEHLTVKEKPLRSCDGRIKGYRIAIRKSIESDRNKACVLAEELGHYKTTVGNILDQTNTQNRKQERRARIWGYNRLIGLDGLIAAYEYGCRTRYDIADCLGVTEKYLDDAIRTYKGIYGIAVRHRGYCIAFEPSLAIIKTI